MEKTRLFTACIIIFAMLMVGPAAADGNFSWDGDVNLTEGTTFTFSPTNNPSAEYEINSTTDLGAIRAAADKGGFEFYTDDAWYSTYGTFSLTGIEGINHTADWSYYWSIYINGAEAPTGLSGNNLNDGDLLQFCYGYSNWTTGVSPTPDNFENIVNITVNVRDDFSWDGDVNLTEGTTFTFSPTNNPSAEYEINSTTDLGAIRAAA
ncbi:MAG: hypothetical protein U9N40_05905, partial [Euryarchaeota archaeon]|nr:hypothetical protein [Euryarchaeota archaeon]